jgi:hypothetical protein
MVFVAYAILGLPAIIHFHNSYQWSWIKSIGLGIGVAFLAWFLGALVTIIVTGSIDNIPLAILVFIISEFALVKLQDKRYLPKDTRNKSQSQNIDREMVDEDAERTMDMVDKYYSSPVKDSTEYMENPKVD